MSTRRSKEEWTEIFRKAKHGHVLWDGNSDNPTDPALAYASAERFIGHAKYLGFFKDNNKVLDIGCGNGRFCIFLSEIKVTYHGLDPMAPCIEFCQEAFTGFPHLNFHFADIYNPHSNPTGKIQPIEYKFPFPDHHFDDIIAYSIFTHLETPEVAAHYMSEIKRMLKPKGNLFITWYRSPPNPDVDPYVGRTVYREADIMTMLNGFSFQFTHGGHTDNFYDQWVMFCKKL